MESVRTPETEQYRIFVPSVSFLVKSPYVIFSIFNFTQSSDIKFQNFDVLKIVNRLFTALKKFHVKNVSTLTPGCIFKNGAPMQVLRKVRMFTKFG